MVVSPVENQDGIAFVEGEYLPIGEAKIPILDWGFLRSDANQDTISVWKGIFFRLEDHLDRFERNVAKLRMICPYNRSQIRSIMRECVRRCGFSDGIFRSLQHAGYRQAESGIHVAVKIDSMPFVFPMYGSQPQNSNKMD